MNIAAVIVAAGSGTRAGGKKPKQYQSLGTKSILRQTLEVFAGHPQIDQIIVVVSHGFEGDLALAITGLPKIKTVLGGASRQASCLCGIAACENADYVLIHDAARPFLSQHLISAVIAGLSDHKAIIPALAISDTIKRVKQLVVEETLDRATLFAAQTPQGFHYHAIKSAHEFAAKNVHLQLTDDASVAEAFGIPVKVIPGEAANIKLTTTEDMGKAMAIFSQKQWADLPDIRTGQGIDFHIFAEGNAIWLCGVEIPHTHKLHGHSDADVALHAITDAILGAIGEGDIGVHFPPSDPQWKGAKSCIFLAKAQSLLEAKGGKISNLDVTILAEAPKISPHIPAMKTELSKQLKLDTSRIAIKATTTEEMGALGRKEGMAAFAIVTVRLP